VRRGIEGTRIATAALAFGVAIAAIKGQDTASVARSGT
jgi:hypothetical protein